MLKKIVNLVFVMIVLQIWIKSSYGESSNVPSLPTSPSPLPSSSSSSSPIPNEEKHTKCAQGLCVVVKGPGLHECQVDRECSHSVCKFGSCILDPNKGVDECSFDSDCGHRECKPPGYCVQVEGIGEDKCSENSECGHKVCDKKLGVCAQTPGQGQDSCKNDSECGHRECVSASCEQVPGKGENSCNNDLDCGHYDCDELGQCILESGVAESKCNPYEEETGCVSRSVCVYGVCEVTAGKGKVDDRCQFDPKTCGHMACASGYCSIVPGIGEDSCDEDKDCGHRECEAGYCVQKGGVGGDRCDEESDCGHKDCKGGYCAQVAGKGPDKCTEDSECGHQECDKEGYCSYVPGKGADKCESIEDCGHLECNPSQGQCVLVPGVGEDKCQVDEECGHRKCSISDGVGICEFVAGVGTHECDSYRDCGHFACKDKKCIFVSELGRDECFSDPHCTEKSPSASPAPSSSPRAVATSSSISSSNLNAKGGRRIKVALHSTKVGEDNAPVKIQMYQDISCGMCKLAMSTIIDYVIQSYVHQGKVQIEFREFPLGFRESEARLAEAAQCASEQGKYFEFLKALYSQDKKLTNEKKILDAASQTSLAQEPFQECVSKRIYQKKVMDDYSQGLKLKINGTPTFFINGIKVEGTKPIQQFKRLIDDALKAKAKKYEPQMF